MSYQANQYKKGWDTGVIKKGGLASRLAAFEQISKPKGDNSQVRGGITDPNILERIRAAKKAAAAGRVTTPKTPLKTWDNKLKGIPPKIQPVHDEKENKPDAEKPKEEPVATEPAPATETPETKPEVSKLPQAAEKPQETEEEAKLRVEKEAKEKEAKEKEAKNKEEAEKKSKEEAEAKAKADAEAKAKADAEANAKAEAENKVKAEQDANSAKAATKIQAVVRSMLCRAAIMKMIEGMIDDLSKKKEENESKFEEDKTKWEEEQARRKVKIEQERKISRQSLAVGKTELTEEGWGWGFVGPLQLPVTRIPHWWMDVSPHKTLFSEDFEEKEDEHWKFRQSHLEKLKEEEGETKETVPTRATDETNSPSCVRSVTTGN
ncbi:MAG: hypothetical protein SGBAC_012479 [Bacillariaceae sp.]